MTTSLEISRSQRLVIIGLLCASLLLAFISQLAGVGLMLFCLFLSRRLRKDWSDSRGTLFLPNYIKAIGTASLRFYGYTALLVIILISHVEPEFAVSVMESNLTPTLNRITTTYILIGISALASVFYMYIFTLIRIGLGMHANHMEINGGFITTLIASCRRITSFFQNTFSKKPALSKD